MRGGVVARARRRAVGRGDVRRGPRRRRRRRVGVSRVARVVDDVAVAIADASERLERPRGCLRRCLARIVPYARIVRLARARRGEGRVLGEGASGEGVSEEGEDGRDDAAVSGGPSRGGAADGDEDVGVGLETAEIEAAARGESLEGELDARGVVVGVARVRGRRHVVREEHPGELEEHLAVEQVVDVRAQETPPAGHGVHPSHERARLGERGRGGMMDGEWGGSARARSL